MGKGKHKEGISKTYVEGIAQCHPYELSYFYWNSWSASSSSFVCSLYIYF